MQVFFDIQHFYYLPQYLPVQAALKKRHINCHFVVHRQRHLNQLLESYLKQRELNCHWVDNKSEAQHYYLEQKPDWVIYGNACELAGEVNRYSKTALMQHGIGPKACYYQVSDGDIQIRFVEGQHRLKRLQQLYPHKTFFDTGYAKLDPIINNELSLPELTQLGLAPNKPTLLYAPTFYPSSIERLPKNLPELLADYNIIIKPHFFSLFKKQYRGQQQRFQHWASFPNVYICPLDEVSILPYYALADLMFSDASSTLFEFTALNKPAIWCDFYQLRWSYRGIFRYRFKQRIDDDLQYFATIAERVTCSRQLVDEIGRQLATPSLKAPQRLKMTEQLVGKVDGQCSERIADIITGEKYSCA